MPIRCCFGGRDGGDGGDDLLWHMDLKPHAYGDYSIAVVQANSSLEDQGQVFTSPSATYVGVYDGHGGPEASRFITNHLFSFLKKFSMENGGLSEEVIRNAFYATEVQFLHLVKRLWPNQPQIASVGSCCLLGAIANNVLYVANLGDSRAVLGRMVKDGERSNSSVVIAERMSSDHNVGVEQVRKEVEALHPDDSHIVVHTHGVWRIKGIIQVSRSIGDIYLKNPEINRDLYHYGYPIQLKRAVMSAEPSLLIRNLGQQDLFLIFASDGLWEQLTDEAAVDIVVKNPRIGIAKRLVRAAIQEAAKKREMKYNEIKRLEKGVRRYYHDDITVVVVFLDQQGSRAGKPKHSPLSECTTVPVDIFSLNSGQLEGVSPEGP